MNNWVKKGGFKYTRTMLLVIFVFMVASRTSICLFLRSDLFFKVSQPFRVTGSHISAIPSFKSAMGDLIAVRKYQGEENKKQR